MTPARRGPHTPETVEAYNRGFDDYFECPPEIVVESMKESEESRVFKSYYWMGWQMADEYEKCLIERTQR